jgi:hypothetical protein
MRFDTSGSGDLFFRGENLLSEVRKTERKSASAFKSSGSDAFISIAPTTERLGRLLPPALALLISWSIASLILRAPDALALPRNHRRLSGEILTDIDCLLISMIIR